MNRREKPGTDPQETNAQVVQVSPLNWGDIFQAIANPAIILDAEYHLLAANRATLELTGKPLVKLIGMPCYEVFHSPSSKKPAKGCPMQKLIAGEGSGTVEMEMEALGKFFLVSCTPIYDDQCKIANIIHIATDISEQKKVELDLARQNRYLAKLNSIAIELSHLTPESRTEEIIAKQLRQLSGAVAVMVSNYDPDKSALYVRFVDTDSSVFRQVSRILGGRIDSIPIPLRDKTYQEIIQQVIGVKRTLHEITFGGISPSIGRAIDRLIKADRYIGLTFVVDEQLYGTSMLAMPKGSSDPPLEILRSFSHMASLALNRKKTAETLLVIQEKYRLLFDTMSEGVVVVDNYDIVQFINPACCNIYGYQPEQVIGKVGYELLIHPDDWNTFKYKNASRLSGHMGTYEVRGIRVNGEQIWLRISGSPIRDKQGKVVGSVGIMSDITQSRSFEDELRRHNAFLDGFIEGAAEAIVVLDKNENILRINKEFTRVFEYTPEEALGRKIDDLIVPADLKNEGEEATSAVAGGKRVQFETQRHSKSGRLIDVSVLGNPIKLEGDQIGIVGIYRDITEKVQLERQLRQSQRLESIGQLAGGVAHDFNNILTVILGYGDELLHVFEPGSPHWHEVAEIIKAGQRAQNLTSQLLAFSRKQMVSPQVLNLNAVIGDMHQMIERLIGEDIELSMNLAGDLGCVKMDGGQIEQVLLNLAVNARDAMPDGGSLRIETSNFSLDREYAAHHISAKPGEYIMMGVADSGSGMDEETKSHIFEPFFSTKDKSSSSGLGLPMVYGIVKQAGGTIWVYSEPGKGSHFKILIPRVFEALAEKVTPQKTIYKNGKGQHILLVEDDLSLKNLIVKIVQKLGYRVTAVANGMEALTAVVDNGLCPDLVITDVVMPEMNGKELADQLKNRLPDLKVLFISGYTDEIIARRGVINPDIPFLQKPFSRDQVADKIEKLLHRD